MSRVARPRMSSANADAFRRIVRRRLKESAVTQEAICPPRWTATSYEGGIRKLKRVLQSQTQLAFEDAYDLLMHLAFESVVSRKGNCEPIMAFAGTQYGRAYQDRNLKKMKELAQKAAIFSKAIKLVQPPDRRPSLAILPGHTKNLAGMLGRIIASQFHMNEADHTFLIKLLRQNLIAYERQLEETEAGIDLKRYLQEKYCDLADYEFLFYGIVKNDPSGRSQRRLFENPWRI